MSKDDYMALAGVSLIGALIMLSYAIYRTVKYNENKDSHYSDYPKPTMPWITFAFFVCLMFFGLYKSEFGYDGSN